jgi:bifunctional isochorismate lyase/aryl carrier protein
MPRPADMPASKVGWRFDPDRAVLLIHDMQRYFLSFYGEESPLVAALVANVARVKAACRSHRLPVVYTAQPTRQSPADRALLNDMWGAGIDTRPELVDIEPALRPDGEDVVLTKWRYSAFIRTELASLMTEWRRDQLVICGVYGHIGCMMTAAHAFQLDVQPFLVGDAIADFSLDEHMMALRYVATRCGVVTTVGALT